MNTAARLSWLSLETKALDALRLGSGPPDTFWACSAGTNVRAARVAARKWNRIGWVSCQGWSERRERRSRLPVRRLLRSSDCTCARTAPWLYRQMPEEADAVIALSDEVRDELERA